jgi:hypothetical protein
VATLDDTRYRSARRTLVNRSDERFLALVFVLVVAVGLLMSESASAEICGDADGNGSVTITDGVQVLRAAAGLAVSCPASRCDVDGSSSVTLTDGVAALRIAAGLQTAERCDVASPRFVDNGDGTVIDNQTGLQWEKKTSSADAEFWVCGDDVEPAVTLLYPPCPDPHEVRNYYSIFNVSRLFLEKLNTPPCFAGHCDWRFPRVNRNGDPAELETLLASPCPPEVESDTIGCIDPIFGPTVSGWYMSGTRVGASPYVMWLVDFEYGWVSDIFDGEVSVRAVRNLASED